MTEQERRPAIRVIWQDGRLWAVVIDGAVADCDVTEDIAYLLNALGLEFTTFADGSVSVEAAR